MNHCGCCLYAIRRNVLLVAEESCQFSFEDGIDAFFDFAAKKFIGGSTTPE